MAVLITGSTDGIGKATAQGLARRGCHILLHGRDPVKSRAVLKEIRKETKNSDIDLLIGDFSSLQHIRKMAEVVRDHHTDLTVLINNAGTYQPARVLTEDGLEMTFAVNVVAPFLLTQLLLPILEANSPARIINVASSAHYDAGEVDWKNLQGERSYDGWQAYCLSKLGDVLLTSALARRTDPRRITVNCLHPGVTCTKLLRAAFPGEPCQSPEAGALIPVFLAASPEVAGVSGKYFEEMKITEPSRISQSIEVQERFWNVAEELALRGHSE